MTQLGMNVSAADEVQAGKAELMSRLEEVRSLPGVDDTKVDDVQSAWLVFADKAAALEASIVEGGSMYPMVWAHAKAALIYERVEQLERFQRNWIVEE